MKNNHAPNRPAKRWRWLIIALLVLVSGLIIWGISWATFARPPLPQAVAALESDDRVKVTKGPWLTFLPAQVAPTTGFIFYPGGRVDPRGYAPFMKAIASEGYLAVVPEMPLNMAVFDPNIADEIIAYYPEISHWVIGGHSVGGTMAAQYTNTHPEVIDGLAIWASYPAGNADLSGFDLPVVTIFGSDDVAVNDSEVMERKHLLPEDTRYVRIEGGDHHQFGSYETNPEDDHAAIDRDFQQDQIIQPTLDLLEAMADSK